MKKPKERKVKVAVSAAFGDSWRKYSKTHCGIKEKLTVFNSAKRKIPPDRLPGDMKDHVLGGNLKGIRECHLDGDVLLLYTHADDLVTLLLVCQHADLKGSKAKELAARIRQLIRDLEEERKSMDPR
jgi:addiction module RelE/StbE family toxin